MLQVLKSTKFDNTINKRNEPLFHLLLYDDKPLKYLILYFIGKLHEEQTQKIKKLGLNSQIFDTW